MQVQQPIAAPFDGDTRRPDAAPRSDGEIVLRWQQEAGGSAEFSDRRPPVPLAQRLRTIGLSMCLIGVGGFALWAWYNSFPRPVISQEIEHLTVPFATGAVPRHSDAGVRRETTAIQIPDRQQEASAPAAAQTLSPASAASLVPEAPPAAAIGALRQSAETTASVITVRPLSSASDVAPPSPAPEAERKSDTPPEVPKRARSRAAQTSSAPSEHWTKSFWGN